MSKSLNQNEESSIEEKELEAGDFGIIIDANGQLKSLMYPSDLEGDPPEEIILILDILGVDLTAPKGSKKFH